MNEGKLRKDVEGLRAIAVLAVVLFHAGLPPFGAGYLGVDMFFVISGYLITGILVREIAEGRLSLLRFYQRRVARIVPALFLTIAAVLVAAFLLFLPIEVARLRGPAVTATLFVSNLYFWRRESYFAPPSETQPLLHTWSLGIEEQFYLLYPLLLFAAMRLAPRRWRLFLIGTAAASFAVAALTARNHPEAAFYLLPARFWELGAGGLGAVFPLAVRPGLREPLCAGGLALLILSLAQIGWAAPWPAPGGLLPCAATLLLLVLGEDSAAGRLLGLAPLRGIGRISYSFYLAHWPLLVVWKTQFGFDLPRTTRIALVLASVAIAALSYLLIERPLRRRLRDARPLPIVAGAAAVGAVLALIAGAATTERWTARRWPPAVLRLLDTHDQRTVRSLTWRDRSCRSTSVGKECTDVRSGMRNVLVAGDSHADHLVLPLMERFPGTHFLVSVQIGCRPVFEGPEVEQGCHAAAAAALKRALAVPLAGVVLAGRWQPTDIAGLVDTVAVLRRHAIPVTVVGPVVEYYPMMPELLARAQAIGSRSWIDHARDLDRERLDAAMAPRVRAAGGTYFSAYRAECPAGQACRLLTRTGRPFHFDDSHYTVDAAREIVARMPQP